MRRSPMAGAHVPAPLLFTASQWTVILGMLAVGLALKAWVIWWLYRDARGRGADPTWWIVAAVAADFATLIVWLIVRPRPWTRNRPPPTSAPAVPPPPVSSQGPEPAEPYHVGFAPRAGSTPVAPSGEQVRVTCPTCQNRFVVTKDPDGPTPLRCDACGTTGRL